MLAPSAHDRPREKLTRTGPGTLGDNELLAVLIGHGTVRADALGIANRLLTEAGGVHELGRRSATQLARVTGIGPALASRIRAAIELGRRTLTHRPEDRVQLLTGKDAANYLLPQFGAYPVERFGVVLLDTKCRVMSTRLIAVGSLNSTGAHPREVFREAVGAGAASVVVFHNHPSGDPTPSPEDVALTHRLLRAGAVVGVRLLDHVILTDTQFCSLLHRARESSWPVCCISTVRPAPPET